VSGKRRLDMTTAEGRKFGLVVGGAFLALAGILWWRDRATMSAVMASIGGVLALGGLIVPQHLGPVERAWMGLAHAISKVTTPVFMAIIFFVVITPAGLIARLAGHRPLVTPAGGTAWTARGDLGGRSDLQRQF
jgi:Saxitoxin biosynthesis operon protein SxtJ